MYEFLNEEQDFGKVPPQVLELEEAVLGAILIDKEAILKVMQVLSGDLFYKESHRKIFNAMILLFEKGEPIDIMTLSNELKRLGCLESIGGTFFLTDLTSKVISSANIEYHANIIVEKHILRQIISECSTIIEKAFAEKKDAFRLLDEVETKIFRLYERSVSKNYIDLNTGIHKAIAQLESYHGSNKKLIGIPTGFSRFDDLTGGLQTSDLIILAGRPGQGKTALALNMVRNMIVESGVAVGFFSLEMSDMQLVQRLISLETEINLQAMRNGTLRDSQWQMMSIKLGKLSSAKLFIDDTPAISLLELRAKTRRLKKEKNIGLIVVDYLQLMRGPKDVEVREREISMISGGLKALAKEVDIPVLALSQLNRQVEGRADKRPQLADLRESGSIEQDADMVCFIHRPETYKIEKYPSDNMLTVNTAEITIAKARNGPIGDFRLSFIKEYTKFGNLHIENNYISNPISIEENPF